MITLNIPVKIKEQLPDGEYNFKTTILVNGDVVTPSNYSLTRNIDSQLLALSILFWVFVFGLIFLWAKRK